jgi:hypothetical protein
MWLETLGLSPFFVSRHPNIFGVFFRAGIAGVVGS